MKKKPNCFLKPFLWVFIFLSSHSAIAQIKDSVNTGSAKGLVQDSAFNFVLSSATVAVYKDRDSSLLAYSLPNNFGEFVIKSLPLDTMLHIVITHVGYRSYFKKFSIAENGSYDFGKINMLRREDGDTLGEVVVTAAAPMRMNGDTLEFNPAAFKLDKNATTEDLIRKLPGFTIWGDGEITFNGKKINSVLVEGKPFMGGDFATATQNLPKEALQRVQVYQQANESNPLDSTMNVNLKLKDDKKMGYFGKVSGGYGTDERYAADAMLSGFNKKQQISVVGAMNNINKVAGNVKQLVESSSYKGEGASIDYQPNFRMTGLNRPVAGGFTYQYDFVPDPQYRHIKRLSADYFMNRNNTLVQRNTTTHTFLDKDNVLSKLAGSWGSNAGTSQRLNARYQKNGDKAELDITAGASLSDNRSFNESSSQQEKTGEGIISTNESRSEGKNRSKNYDMKVLLRKREVDYNRTRPRAFNLSYDFDLKDNSGSSYNTTRFRSAVNPAADKDYSRLYDQQDAFSLNNHLIAEYPDLKRLIFGRKRIGDIGISLSNELFLRNNTYNDRVLDYDTSAEQHRLNSYLTSKRDLDITDLQPSLNFSKYFSRQLSNRYYKSLYIELQLREQYYSMKHRSNHGFQNFDRAYKRFIPGAGLNYFNNQYGSFYTSHSLRYATSVDYPEVNHIAPLADSSDVLYIPRGNAHIRPEYQRSLNYNFNFNSQKSKDQYFIDGSLSLGKTDDKIADSSFYDSLGRRINYSVNVNGHRFIRANLNFRKSLQVKKSSSFQFGLRSSYNADQTPNYVNNRLNVSFNRSISGNLNVNYSFKDILSLRVGQRLEMRRSEQKGFDNNVFNSKTLGTEISGALQLPKNLTWSSNISYNRNTANRQEPVKFTLWNASLTCRFLKGNRGEVKFSALDLLHQNKSIINYAGPNSQTFGYANVLQQYYMLTLSYYPRKFGR